MSSMVKLSCKTKLYIIGSIEMDFMAEQLELKLELEKLFCDNYLYDFITQPWAHAVSNVLRSIKHGHTQTRTT